MTSYVSICVCPAQCRHVTESVTSFQDTNDIIPTNWCSLGLILQLQLSHFMFSYLTFIEMTVVLA